MKPACVLLIALSILTAAAPAQEPPSAAESAIPDAVQGIAAKEIGGHLRFIASDLMRGRDTLSPEIQVVAEYLAGQLAGAGAEPAGDLVSGSRTYFAQFPLTTITPLADQTSLTLILERNSSRREIPFTTNQDFFLFPQGVPVGEIEAPVVFAGQGRTGAVNDYDDLEVKDRIVLIVEGGPEEAGQFNTSSKDRPRRRARRLAPIGSALGRKSAAEERGALGLVIVRPRELPSAVAGDSTRFMTEFFGRPSLTLGEPSASIPGIFLGNAIRDAIEKVEDITGEDSEPRLLDGVKIRFRFGAKTETKFDRNVVGIFPGSDPERKHELIVLSAHYDHVGVGEDGQIFNGSDDNGSGTSGLLEIAEALGEGPRPARSVALLWVSGEEKGLLGSKWFADHLPWGDDYKIIANINMDMISRNHPKKVSITPSPGHAEHGSLVDSVQAALDAEGMEGVFDADEFFGRTDSYNFAAKNIPVIFLFSGIHSDYHRPGDDFAKADLEKAARVTRVAYRLLWSVAQASDLPTRTKDKPAAASESAATGETAATVEAKD
jgi:hypothetical protein